MKTYSGHIAVNGDRHVWVSDNNGTRKLNPRYDLANHSPTGFAWGYGGSGPAQLSLALLADCLQRDDLALTLYQTFKWKSVCRLSIDNNWTLTEKEIQNTVAGILSDEVDRFQEKIERVRQGRDF